MHQRKEDCGNQDDLYRRAPGGLQPARRELAEDQLFGRCNREQPDREIEPIQCLIGDHQKPEQSAAPYERDERFSSK